MATVGIFYIKIEAVTDKVNRITMSETTAEAFRDELSLALEQAGVGDIRVEIDMENGFETTRVPA